EFPQLADPAPQRRLLAVEAGPRCPPIRRRLVGHGTLVPDVFAPDLGIAADVVGEHLHARLRPEVDDLDAARAQPVDAALEVDRLADDHGADAELTHQPAAIPARGERRHHDRVAIAALPPRLAKRVGLGVDRRVVLLDPAIVARAEKLAAATEDRGADRDSALGQAA